MTNAQVADHYANCIKLSTENVSQVFIEIIGLFYLKISIQGLKYGENHMVDSRCLIFLASRFENQFLLLSFTVNLASLKCLIF